MVVRGRKPFKTKSGRSNYGGNKGDLRRTARRAYAKRRPRRKCGRKKK